MVTLARSGTLKLFSPFSLRFGFFPFLSGVVWTVWVLFALPSTFGAVELGLEETKDRLLCGERNKCGPFKRAVEIKSLGNGTLLSSSLLLPRQELRSSSGSENQRCIFAAAELRNFTGFFFASTIGFLLSSPTLFPRVILISEFNSGPDSNPSTDFSRRFSH